MKNITETEVYVIELIRQGMTNKEIADKFHISELAVKSRIHRLLIKHNCRNRVQLALIDIGVSRESI